jgi:predicted ATPase/class 3 adenylate cyclase
MPDLPSGTVTFLFTDIEGSTALWERDRGAMALAVARHLALLCAVIETHRGVLYKVVGDAVQAAFPTAPDAVTASLAAQQALGGESWPEGIGPVRVRMALHTAAATPQDEDYLAPGLNRLSRLLAAAHGGQVLLSLATQDLARDALPLGVSLRDLGEHALRDLYRPERVFQVLHPDLPADFPAIRTLATRPNNLPLQPTPFLGREDQVARIVDLLHDDDVRLLTITGPGGVGKTRVALQAAADLLEDFPEGVWFVDLSAFDDPILVPSAIAGVLGVRDEGSGLTERLARVLSEKKLLLVLDNFERVVEAAQVVADLVVRVPSIKVLVTSRTPLHAYGEREYPLAPLLLPDPTRLPSLEHLTQYETVRLFISRAQAVKPDFEVTNDSAPAVAEICSRLDGLPLAIELAAAFVKILPPQALLKRLEKRLPLLTGGARTLPTRQQTMRNAIAWSHDLLSPMDQTLFRRLAVFAGGCTIEAAETIVDPEGSLDVFGGIASLVDKSLLRQEEGVEGEPRFQMLETVREFGLERLTASGEEPASRERHARWVLALVERAEPELFGRDQQTWWERVEAELPNIRAALAWVEQIGDAERAQRLAGSASAFCWLRGHLREGQDWLRRALALPGETSPAVHSAALAGAGTLAWFCGDNDAAETLLEQGLAIARDGDFALGVAAARQTLAGVAWARGDLDQALTLGAEAITGLREVGSAGRLAVMLADMGMIAELNGDHEQGDAWSTEGLTLHRTLGTRWFIANHLADLGVLAQRRGDLVAAAQHYSESVSLLHEMSDTWYIAGPLAGLAAIAVAHDHPKEAARLLGLSAALREKSGYGVWPMEQERDEQTVAAARAALGDEGYFRAFAEGRGISFEQTVAEAIALVNDIAGAEASVG